MKLKAIIALLVLSLFAVGNAHAVLTTATDENATMAFTFVDTDTQLSHIVDTGISIASLFEPGTLSSTGFSIDILTPLGSNAPADLLDSSGGGFVWSFVGGSQSDFYTNNLGGYVAGFDSGFMPVEQGTPNANGSDFLATTALIQNNLGTYFNENANGTNTSNAGDAAGFDNFWKGTFGGNQAQNAFTTGDTMTLWGYANTIESASPLQIGTEIVALGTLVLDQVNGILTYTPVPLPAAVWLLGSALLGLVGFSRRKANQVAA